MNWGLENRLSGIFQRDGKTLMLAVDHGYFQGPLTGLENPRKTIEPLISYADVISPTRGLLTNCVDPKIDKAVILRISGGNSMAASERLPDETILTSIEEAVKLNCAGVSVSVYIGSEYQKQTLENLAKTVREAEKYDMVVLGIVALGNELKEKQEDVQYLKTASRQLAEYGANIVKTYSCKNNFSEVVQGCFVPIVVAGGKKVPEKEVFETVYRVMQEGAKGVDMGRNIFQARNPVRMIQSIAQILHNGCNVEKALSYYSFVNEGQDIGTLKEIDLYDDKDKKIKPQKIESDDKGKRESQQKIGHDFPYWVGG